MPSATRSRATGGRGVTRSATCGTPRWCRCSRPTTSGVLQATTLIELLQERHPGQFDRRPGAHAAAPAPRLARRARPDPGGLLRAGARRGSRGGRRFHARDRARRDDRGALLEHLLFEFVLSFSGWHVGVPRVRRDLRGARLRDPRRARGARRRAAGAALRQSLGSDARATPHRRASADSSVQAVLDHYGMSSTRIQPGESHENGVVEQRHRRTKRALAEALVIRGSKDFDAVEEYTALVVDIVDRRNRGSPTRRPSIARRFGRCPPRRCRATRRTRPGRAAGARFASAGGPTRCRRG